MQTLQKLRKLGRTAEELAKPWISAEKPTLKELWEARKAGQKIAKP